MIYDGALAVGGIFAIGRWVWCLVIGALIIVWIAVGVTDLGWINKITMAALFILTLVLCKVIFFSGNAMVGIDGESLTFGAAVELAVAMPLSWLPLISDYTRDAEKPTQATWVSVLVYGAVSCWMYVIGMGAAIFTGEYDIAVIMVKAGLGIAALIILVFSTVTTTFLDAWSAGISAESLSAKLNGKKTAIAVTVIGTAAAILFPMDDITGFLYLIGSVFAPMIAVQIADHFILHRDRFAVAADARNLVIWLVGFIAYRLLMALTRRWLHAARHGADRGAVPAGRKSKTYQANVKARRTRCKQQNSTLYFAKPVLFWSTGGSYNGSIISKKTR